ncbi:MAG: helix-turn-helix transcriptional regulator [Candidatus Hydrogenedentes bacterium]|nr:helix-turn-helix transcriptional regulator [Candidatus Hydrogenedentota bacterium]
MANFATTFKEEIRRLARKEIKDNVGRLQKVQAELRRSVAALKRRIGKLETENRRLARTAAGSQEPASAQPEQKADRAIIRGKAILKLREKLRLTQAEFARLVGVSAQSVYQWERKGGRLRLRSATRAALLDIRNIGAREARSRLEVKRGKRK